MGLVGNRVRAGRQNAAVVTQGDVVCVCGGVQVFYRREPRSMKELTPYG